MTANRRPGRLDRCVGVVAMAMLFVVACGGDEDRARAVPTPLERPDAQAAAPSDMTEDAFAPATEASPGTIPGGLSTGGRLAEELNERVDLPASFPSDAPIYPGTEPSQYVEGQNGRLSLTFGTADGPEQVMAYMKSELPKRRWNITAEHDLETGRLLQATKGDRLISVLLSRVDEGQAGQVTMIAMSVDP